MGVRLYSQLVAGIEELFVKDSAGNDVQITSGGTVYGASGTWSRSDKNKPALATFADGDVAVGSGITATPTGGGYVMATVNGKEATVGDGTKVGCDCYFSADGGLTARMLVDVTLGDLLYWNGSVAGYQLATTDRISLHYLE